MGGTAVTSSHYADEVFFVLQKNKEVVKMVNLTERNLKKKNL